MKRCRYLHKDERHLRFFHLVEDESGFREQIMANAIFTTLWPVVRPLEVKLTIGARLPYEYDDISAPARDWRLREVYVPAHVEWTESTKETDRFHSNEEEIPELTLPALADWLARAHVQQLPEGYVPVLDSLNMHTTRARLLEHQGPFAELTWGTYAYSIPVEKREDGLWVSGPMRNALIKAPIDITFWRLYSRLELDITVYWSLWITAGSAEAELLLSCLLELEKQGWNGEKPATDWLRRT